MLFLVACEAEPLPVPTPSRGEEVALATADGLTLEADWYESGAGAPAALLLHMSPYEWDRTSWPASFVEGLRDDGWAVLAPDRRGAGGSDGEPVDAYVGPNGVLDARAAVDFLLEQGAPSFVVVAASDGTTTALDYAVMASAAGYPAPEAQAWLSPGDYTENNHAFAELEQARMFFGFPPEEEGWVGDVVAPIDPGDWVVRMYEGGLHGTLLFESNPEVAGEIRSFLR